MCKQELTPWFNGIAKPVRHGVYERDYGLFVNGRRVFSRWDGERWREGEWTIRDAARASHTSPYQDFPWRGLASDPAKKGKA